MLGRDMKDTSLAEISGGRFSGTGQVCEPGRQETQWLYCDVFGAVARGCLRLLGGEEKFLRRRAVEIKHAAFPVYLHGYFVPEYSRFSGCLSPSPLFIKFSDVPNGLGAFLRVPLAKWLQIVTTCSLI